MSIPIILAEYFNASTGKDYGVGIMAKLRLARRMAKNRKKITTASHFLEHLMMATQLLKVPPAIEGCVVECGSYKGGSAANLSLVCALCNRRLEIFDSFGGLPAPSNGDNQHLVVRSQEVHTYSRGAYCGSLPEVRENIARYGAIEVCNFNVGNFEETLPRFKRQCVLIFLDVDLIESLKTCFKHLWPLLQDGSCLFSHEAHHSEVASLFFEDAWWQSNVKCRAPGLIGAGTGLGLLPSPNGFRSDLGYTVKNPSARAFEVSPQTGGTG